ncbi:acetyltransferase [Mesorhizobium australicum WSM2073]|uniref:Acetyltransferase n=1 Tax=Mesorhizobium australicum (strain HAMBI 3006 / LMG 24608 / WSM2073) TaxID=754035 RepID=L0KLD4_MESAW|nr:GNAT family N-acetyltransferase [Mesorhizobium australicum]AGB45485.1 acetyltransferase [Mesorhizobium australicum WSM2073]
MAERSGSTADIRIGPVTPANRALVTALQLAPEQMDFVASNAASLREARSDRDARPRAVMAGDQIVGFLMYEAPRDDDEARIYRFMIDRASQGRGYGKGALREVLEEIDGLGHIRHVSICYEPENEAARQLYRSAGFVEQGLDEDGEMIADLILPTGDR